MYQYKANFPNVRALFQPDPGYTMCACDLDRADAQVVAWDAGDEELKQIFREGLDLHLANARSLFRLDFSLDALRDGLEAERLAKVYGKERRMAKQGVHAVNYGVQARTLAATLGITLTEAENFISFWLSAHEPIREWHRSTEYKLKSTGVITNAFGFKIELQERYSIKALQEFLAWVPQSTVGLVINHGWANLDENMTHDVEVLLQVHDELVFQVKTYKLKELKPQIRKNLLIEVPYEDPLVIPVGLKTSVRSWGHLKEDSWEN